MRGFRLEKRYVFMAQLYVHDGKTPIFNRLKYYLSSIEYSLIYKGI